MPDRFRVSEWVLGVVGLAAGAVAAWMYFVPSDWFIGGLEEGWYLGLATASGLLLAGAFGLYARAAHAEGPPSRGQAIVMDTLTVLALAAGVTFGVIWLF
jgi:hypothetical protein